MIWRCGISHPGTHIHVDTPVLSQCSNSWMLRIQMLTTVPSCFAAGSSAFQPLRAQVLIYSTATLFHLTTQSDHSTACPMARLHLSSGKPVSFFKMRLGAQSHSAATKGWNTVEPK